MEEHIAYIKDLIFNIGSTAPAKGGFLGRLTRLKSKHEDKVVVKPDIKPEFRGFGKAPTL